MQPRDLPSRDCQPAPRIGATLRAWMRVVGLTCVMALSVAAPARADFTAFLGASPTPETRWLRGLSAGSGVLVIGWEFEYATLAESETAPGLTTGFGNLLLQTPGLVSPVQVYGTTGVGLYRERLGTRQETHVGSTFGGGVKIRVAGPLRVRLDYRLLRLQGTPLERNVHRYYVGANIGF